MDYASFTANSGGISALLTDLPGGIGEAEVQAWLQALGGRTEHYLTVAIQMTRSIETAADIRLRAEQFLPMMQVLVCTCVRSSGRKNLTCISKCSVI